MDGTNSQELLSLGNVLPVLREHPARHFLKAAFAVGAAVAFAFVLAGCGAYRVLVEGGTMKETLFSESVDAVRMPAGGLEIEYRVDVSRLWLSFGHLGQITVPRTQGREYVMSREELENSKWVKRVLISSRECYVLYKPRKGLPVVLTKYRPVRGEVFPGYEAILRRQSRKESRDGLYWYKPLKETGEDARVVPIELSKRSTPLWAYPLRLVLLPPQIACDIVLLPSYLLEVPPAGRAHRTIPGT